MPSSDPHRRAKRPTFVSFAILVALLAAACGSTTPSAQPHSSAPPASVAPSSGPTASPSAAPTGSAAAPSASSDTAAANAIYDAIETQVQAIRGLKATKAVPRQFITSDELRTMLTQQFDQDSPAAYVAATARLYKALGLIPADSDLRGLTLDLLGGGVAGFYRNDQGKLYVVSKTGEPGAAERFYFSHEYDHALQDQNTTVFKDQDGILDQSDRLLARSAIYEGDATLLMTLWGVANLTVPDLQELIAAGNDPEVQGVLARTPAILRAPLEFPYDTGARFVQSVYSRGGWTAVNDLYKRMPESTEQILHADKYTAAEAPVKVVIPADLATRLGTGWTVPLQDTFGELQIGIWLRDVRGTTPNPAPTPSPTPACMLPSPAPRPRNKAGQEAVAVAAPWTDKSSNLCDRLLAVDSATNMAPRLPDPPVTTTTAGTSPAGHLTMTNPASTMSIVVQSTPSRTRTDIWIGTQPGHGRVRLAGPSS